MGVKRGLVICFLFVFLFVVHDVSALGVSPGRKTFDFKGGLEETILYSVKVDTDKVLKVSVEGDLAPYVTLSRDTLTDERTFSVTLKLPDTLEMPGLNRGFIVVSEQIDPERADFIGTAVTIKSLIDVYVPYPGRYLELTLSGDDANIGETVDFVLDVTSRGDEDVSITPQIDIYSQDGRVATLVLTNRVIVPQEELHLRKTLNTSGYNPGEYKAVASVDYGVVAQDEVFFRIGNLSIAILNYTNQLHTGGLVPFKVIIASGWNDVIDGAYADVTLFNATHAVARVKTTTTDLRAWEEKEIVGYIDATNFSEGNYTADITVRYFGRSVGSSTSARVGVVFFAKPEFSYWWYVGGAGVILFLVSFLIRLLLFHYYKSKGKSRGKKK